MVHIYCGKFFLTNYLYDRSYLVIPSALTIIAHTHIANSSEKKKDLGFVYIFRFSCSHTLCTYK